MPIGAGALVQWLKLPAWKVGNRGFEPHSGSNEQNVSSPLSRKDSTLWGASVTEKCSASYRRGSNSESSVWRAVSSHSSHHPREVLLAQFSLYVHKGGLKPHSFHFMPIVR